MIMIISTMIQIRTNIFNCAQLIGKVLWAWQVAGWRIGSRPPEKRGRAFPTGSGRPPSGFPQYLRGSKIMRNGCWRRRRRTDGEEQGAETMPSLRRSTANPSHTYIGLPPAIRKPPTMRKPPTIASLPQSDNPPPTFQC